MYKENGREKPAANKTYAANTSYTYVCGNCGHEEVTDKKVFGEVKQCVKCGTQLTLKN